MDAGVMQVLKSNYDVCIVHSGFSKWGIYAAIFDVIVFSIVWAALNAYCKTKGYRPPSTPVFLVVLFIFGVGVPAFISGESNTLTFSRANSSVVIEHRQFLLFNSSEQIALDQVANAANTGRNNQLRLNLVDGGYVYIGYDTFEGGRDNAAAAINAWLGDYRGRPVGPS